MKPGRLDQPEIHIAVFGFLTAFVWEMWQMPFYAMSGESTFAITRMCTLASVGDAVLMVGAYLAVSLFARSRFWLRRTRLRDVILFLLIGLVVTIVIEKLATQSIWGWQYSDRMPLISGTGVAVIPVLMWIIIPLIALWFARRQPLSLPRERT